MKAEEIRQVLRIVDEWLNSDDVFITNGQGGEVLKDAWIDCKRGSLLKRLCGNLPPTIQPTFKHNKDNLPPILNQNK